MLTRIAPTPSGFLHSGNAVHCLLVQKMASHLGAEIALRIDDIDAARTRPEYVDDVFDVLQWLGIDWSTGPRSASEFRASWRQADRIDVFRRALEDARAAGMPLYMCECTRKDFTSFTGLGCPRSCRHRDVDPATAGCVVRVHVPASTRIDVARQVVFLDESMGDFVVWRRDDLPAYQFASLVTDLELGTDLIIRGEDLRDSTAAQLYLSEWMPGGGLRRAHVFHHSLVRDHAGHKLSKSAGNGALPIPRTQTQLQSIIRTAEAIGLEFLSG